MRTETGRGCSAGQGGGAVQDTGASEPGGCSGNVGCSGNLSGAQTDLGKVAGRELVQIARLLADDLFGVGLENLTEIVGNVDLLGAIHRFCQPWSALSGSC